MNTKQVDTIVSNEEHIRLRIYDGEIAPDAYHEELLRLEREPWLLPSRPMGSPSAARQDDRTAHRHAQNATVVCNRLARTH